MYRKYIKRVFDFVLSLLAIILLSPLILILVILIKINLGSPVIFKQKRVGLNENIFTMYKFRTMTDEKGKNGKLLPDNLRSTKLGNILRKTSLDELPELFNIIKGDMSIVGPRPLLVSYLPFYTNEERKRHNMRPGLTGLAQVSGRNFLSWEDRFRLDNKYIEKCNIILDFKIIIKTLFQVLKSNDVAEMSKVKSDKNGTYVYHEGKMFRRLDIERSSSE